MNNMMNQMACCVFIIVRDKFPLEMADIQGAVVAADINDDGKIELVTTGSHGNVAAWTAQSKEIWERHLKGLVPQGPAVGDVDGDLVYQDEPRSKTEAKAR